MFKNSCLTSFLLLLLVGCASPKKEAVQSAKCDDLFSLDVLELCGEDRAFKEDFFIDSYELILQSYQTPEYKDGSFKGAVKFCLDNEGNVNDVFVLKPSGYDQLDQAFMNAVIATKKFPVPANQCYAENLYRFPIRLFYNETDLVKPE